jgi:putative two-component system response regulator
VRWAQDNPAMFSNLDQARILIVDDEPANLKLLQKMLVNQGYSNITALNDPTGVLCHIQANVPDIILLDINMPGMDGYDVMRMLKRQNFAVPPPILVLTAQRDHETMVRCLSSGARDFLSKPFEFQELWARVRNLLEAHLAMKMARDQNNHLEEEVLKRTEELRFSRLEVVRRLSIAAEYRDQETGGHIMRISKMSALMAKYLGWSEVECDLMLNASPLHDVGKIGIPDAILQKPGRLEPDEWEIMQGHVEIGVRILGNDQSPLFTMAREIVISHHEKWDGCGYPTGLSGENIPLSGRIVALVDVYDALRSERPYKKAWDTQSTQQFIAEQSSKHFDPELVELFLNNINNFEEIREKHQQ